MNFYNLPLSLKSRVRERYEYAWKQYRDLQSDEFLYGLCPSLKEDIHAHMYSAMLRQVALFEGCEDQVRSLFTVRSASYQPDLL